ncbi:hypothetical protein [Zooshikella harenae]|uniref:Uncharacterized protein n=1 Tax=Zooshikella harenae TaxID=2827238 RepID=A0ABS5ZHW9_9GAMM|nr:hypothetical protein [Zooshikella harenae]MBU2713525.1 hypothetical protein [Zooshikella harenae]
MNKQEKTAFIGATIYILLAIVSTVDIFFTTIKNEGVIGLIAAFWISKLYIITIPFSIIISYKILSRKKHRLFYYSLSFYYCLYGV